MKKGKLVEAWGYQGDAMNLPVADVDAAAPFYVDKMGFRLVKRDLGRAGPRDSHTVGRVVLERDDVRMALVENGGDPSQDGVAFRVEGVGDLLGEFISRGVGGLRGVRQETHDDGIYNVFFVVAPDGLCFWFGEKE